MLFIKKEAHFHGSAYNTAMGDEASIKKKKKSSGSAGSVK